MIHVVCLVNKNQYLFLLARNFYRIYQVYSYQNIFFIDILININKKNNNEA